MSASEARAHAMVKEALDTALRRAGLPVIECNADFVVDESGAGFYPALLLVKSGVAPLRLVMGPVLDVWIGPYSEVVSVDTATCERDEMIELLERLLRSKFTITSGRWAVKITAQLSGSQPWLALRIWGRGGVHVPSQAFLPYVSGGSMAQERFE